MGVPPPPPPPAPHAACAVAYRFVICGEDSPCPVVERFQAQLMMLEMGERALFTAGYDAVLHVHCCDEEVTVEKVCEHGLRVGVVRARGCARVSCPSASGGHGWVPATHVLLSCCVERKLHLGRVTKPPPSVVLHFFYSPLGAPAAYPRG